MTIEVGGLPVERLAGRALTGMMAETPTFTRLAFVVVRDTRLLRTRASRPGSRPPRLYGRSLQGALLGERRAPPVEVSTSNR